MAVVWVVVPCSLPLEPRCVLQVPLFRAAPWVVGMGGSLIRAPQSWCSACWTPAPQCRDAAQRRGSACLRLSSAAFAAKAFFFFPSQLFPSETCLWPSGSDRLLAPLPPPADDMAAEPPALARFSLPCRCGLGPVGTAASAGKSSWRLLEPEKTWHRVDSSRSQKAQMVLNVRERCECISETACPGAMAFCRQPELWSQHPPSRSGDFALSCGRAALCPQRGGCGCPWPPVLRRAMGRCRGQSSPWADVRAPGISWCLSDLSRYAVICPDTWRRSGRRRWSSSCFCRCMFACFPLPPPKKSLKSPGVSKFPVPAICPISPSNHLSFSSSLGS